MKPSEKPTKHILVKAFTDSEWDSCDYAVIDCGEGWKDSIAKRLEPIRHLVADNTFFKALYFDGGASFHCSDEYLERDEVLPADREWSFVELEEGEADKLGIPETWLDQVILEIYKDGDGRYSTSGKNTSDEFFTETIPLREMLESMR